MLTIVDYGMGNLQSVRNMLLHLGYEAVVTSDLKQIENATKIILPGVGNFAYAMKNIQDSHIKDSLDIAVLERQTPLLGICLGMQLLTCYSEEGESAGLGYIKATTSKFDSAVLANNKIPHMGWDFIKINNKIPLMKGIEENDRFYFVHSYYVGCQNNMNSIATTRYGVSFDSVIGQDNILGVQFHPEKSHRFGMKIIKNFMENY